MSAHLGGHTITVERKPGWYHSMTADFAWDNYGFPLNPEKGYEFIAEDGSLWEFNVHGLDRWDLINYSGECDLRH